MSKTIDERWCLPKSGYASGSYELVRKHLNAAERAVCELAQSYTEDRTTEGPLIVTCDDVQKAIAVRHELTRKEPKQ